MTERIKLEWDNVDEFKKLVRTYYNWGFNDGKREIFNNGDRRIVREEHLYFANAERIDPITELFLKELS